MANIRAVVYVTVILFAVSIQSHAQPIRSAEYGYGGICEPGYGEDCSPRGSESTTTSESTTAGSSMLASPGLQSVGSQKHSGSGGADIAAIDSTTASPDCNVKIPEACTFPFVYKGMSFDSCTGIDGVGIKWCSTDTKYAGHWRQCTEPCKNRLVHGVVTGVVATGVAAAGVGLIAAAINSQKQAVSTSLPQAVTTTVVVASAPAPGNQTVAPAMPPVLAATAATPSSFPASRLFELSSLESIQNKGSLRGQHSNHVATQQSRATLLLCFALGLCALCCCAAVCGVLLHVSGTKKGKRKKADKVTVEEITPINQGL
jgi:hypothetical protein